MNSNRNTLKIQESELVARLKAGDETAYGILVKTYQVRLYKVAFGITGDREESLDIVQEVFIKVYNNIHSFREDAALLTWLHRITINQCSNWVRWWKRRFRWQHDTMENGNSENAGPPSVTADTITPESDMQKKEFREIYRKQLNALPEKIRVVFVLYVIEGRSYQEIAQTLGIKEGTVCSRLFQARQKLKKAIS